MSDTSEMLKVRAGELEGEILDFIRACMSEREGGGPTVPVGGTLMVFSIPSVAVANPRLLQSAYAEIENGFLLLRKALEGPNERWE